jgi:hypothetical protein
VGASAAGPGALTEVTPFGVHAVDRTVVGVTFLGVLCRKARDTTILSLANNVTAVCTFASTAGSGTGGPSSPHAHDAIDGALLAVAGLRIVDSWAHVPTMIAMRHDATRAVMFTTATTGIAIAPLGPIADHAVDRTMAEEAGLGLR